MVWLHVRTAKILLREELIEIPCVDCERLKERTAVACRNTRTAKRNERVHEHLDFVQGVVERGGFVVLLTHFDLFCPTSKMSHAGSWREPCLLVRRWIRKLSQHGS